MKGMRRIYIVSIISVAIVLFASINIHAQESKSDSILKSIYDNFATTTDDEQYEALKELRVAAKSENNRYNYNFALSNLATYAYQMKDDVAFTEYAEEAYTHWQNEPNLNRERVYYTAGQVIFLEFAKGNNRKALELYFIMLSDFKKDTSSSEYLTEVYSNLSSDYRSIGDLESALLYNEKVIELIDQNHSDDPNEYILRGDIESTQGHIYRDKNDYQSALNYYNRSISNLKKYNDDYHQSTKGKLLIESYLGRAKTSLLVNDLEDAKKALDEAEKIQIEVDFQRYQTLEIRGQYYIQIKDHEKGQELLASALEETIKGAFTSKKFPREARITMRMGDGKKMNDDLISALHYYHDALKYIDTTTVEKNLRSNPKIEHIIHTKQALEILQKKAKTAVKIFGKNNDRDYLDIAINAYQAAVELLDKMKVNYLNQKTKYFIASNATNLYNEYIKLLADQYEDSKNDDLISNIYMIAERNKSTIAFDELQYKYELANAQIPEDLKQKHQDLKIDISYNERLLSDLKTSKSNDLASISKLEKKVFNLNEEFITLDQKLNREYAQELSNREGLLQFPSMKEIQSSLGSGDLFIETFQSENHIYFIGFDQHEHHLHKIPITKINEVAEQYIDIISTRPSVPLHEDVDFIRMSNELYNATLKTFLDRFSSKKRLLIVPDGLLSSIPFESLITDKSNPLSFLIHDYNIAYLYASRQVISKKTEFQDVSILSLAPQFNGLFSNVRSCDRDSLSSLPFARKESEYLSESYLGTFLNSGDVKKSDLIDNINSHQIIHIGTHACVNQVDPMLNEIHFSDTYITNKEIENQLASPELIVLGACNTANGKYIKGQGLLSLSKGFLQAGAKCIQASLWEIDDFSSSEIIKTMFANLQTGIAKSDALRSSKISFIEKADRLRVHPYFWAGIIQTGDDTPLFYKTNELFSNLYIQSILAMLLLLGFVYLIKCKFF